jgi:hypothetical protein
MGFPLSDAEHAAIKARIEAQQELIVSAAIRVDRWIVTVERPGRHGDCINFLHSLGQNCLDQGFVTNRGRFVGREEAGQIAEAAGQTTRREGLVGLFSEDVWNDLDVEPTDIDPAGIF